MTLPTGEKHGNWKGEDITYSGAHGWLRNKYGKANKCENASCEGRSKKFNWSLIHGISFTKRREAFRMLCVSCHRRYDDNPMWRKRHKESQGLRKRTVIFRGEKRYLFQLCEEYGLGINLVYLRLRRGWDIEKALLIPRKR